MPRTECLHPSVTKPNYSENEDMKSQQVTIVFPPIPLEKPIDYLRKLHYSNLIPDFFTLDESGMAAYETPSCFDTTRQGILDGRYGKESADYKNYNTFATAFYLIRACAKINVAIYALKEKYRTEEKRLPYNITDSFSYSIIGEIWDNTTDEDALRIKSAAVDAKNRIQTYSPKYTSEDFEEGFINLLKYPVYEICHKFGVDTRTLTQKSCDLGANVLFNIISFAIFCLAFGLLAKCATS